MSKVTESDIATAREVAARHRERKTSPPSFLGIIQAYKVLDVQGRAGKPLEVEAQAVARGDRTIVTELANGSIGYIPTRRAIPGATMRSLAPAARRGLRRDARRRRRPPPQGHLPLPAPAR